MSNNVPKIREVNKLKTGLCCLPFEFFWFKMDNAEDNIKEYRWETGYERTWEAITEDTSGLIEVSVQEMLQRARRKKMMEKSGHKVKLGMMRHLYIILDMSDNMKLQDMKPSRLLCVLNLLERFIEEFFHLNPISQLD